MVTLCTSIFMDGVIFAHNGSYGGMSIQHFDQFSFDVKWSSQKWTRAQSVVIRHVAWLLPICADNDVIIRDDGVVHTALRCWAVTKVARPWSGGILSGGESPANGTDGVITL